MDLHVEVGPVTARALNESGRTAQSNEPDAPRERIACARRAQAERSAAGGGRACLKAELSPRALERCAPLSLQASARMADACERNGLSARGFHRVWRVARTIGDLDGAIEWLTLIGPRRSRIARSDREALTGLRVVARAGQRRARLAACRV